MTNAESWIIGCTDAVRPGKPGRTITPRSFSMPVLKEGLPVLYVFGMSVAPCGVLSTATTLASKSMKSRLEGDWDPAHVMSVRLISSEGCYSMTPGDAHGKPTHAIVG